MYSTGEKDNVKLTWSPLAKGTAAVLIAGIILLGVNPMVLQFVLNRAPATVAAAKM